MEPMLPPTGASYVEFMGLAAQLRAGTNSSRGGGVRSLNSRAAISFKSTCVTDYSRGPK
jgi:hypothetical protein